MGRPKKESNVILVNNILLNFISKKEDAYGNEICYFKCVDKNKLKPVMVFQNLKMPYFVGDNGAVILRVKNKFVNYVDEFKKQTYLCDLVFESYNFETENGIISGFYLKVPKVEVSEIQSV